jgi:hypothetical protein
MTVPEDSVHVTDVPVVPGVHDCASELNRRVTVKAGVRLGDNTNAYSSFSGFQRAGPRSLH